MTQNARHRRYRRWVSLDLDGRLPPDRRPDLETHLGECTECRRQREALVAARAEFEAAPRILASVGFADRVMSVLAREVISPWLEALPLVRGLAASALAVCVLAMSLILLGGTPAGRGAPDLPMGRLDRVTRHLFENGSVPADMLPAPRALGSSTGKR
jgi:anti-sigma factor RsiW